MNKSDIKSLVAEVHRSSEWETLRADARTRYEQLHGHKTYKDGLMAALDPQITTRIALPSRRPSIAARQTTGILNMSLSYHAEAWSKKNREERHADFIELYFAHLWTTIFDRGGLLFSATRRHQATSPFAAWWLEWEKFELPKDKAEQEDYRKRYQPFSLSVLNPLTASFLPDDNGHPTMAVREFEIPYIEVAKRYGGWKSSADTSPLIVLGRQFPGLRGAGGRALEDNDLSQKRAKVCVVDDGYKIGHWLDLRGGGTEYEAAAEEVDNPWGRPGMFVVHSVYNPEGLTLADRYRPLVDELLVEQRNYDVIRTHLASLAFTPNKFGQELSPEVAAAALLEDKTIPAAEFAGGVATLYGKQATFGNQPSQAAWELLNTQTLERDAALPPQYLTNPDQQVLKAATAAAQLQAHETSNRMYDDARRSLIGAVVEVSDAIKHFMTGGYLNKAKVGQESLWIRPTGQEPIAKFAGDFKDREIELTPDIFGMDYTLEVTAAAQTQSQKAMEYELKRAQVMDGAAEHADLVAVTTEDVTGKTLKINEEKMYQTMVPAAMNLTFLKFMQTEMADSGLNLVPLAMQAGLLDPSIMGQQPMQGGMGDGMGGARTDPPATAVPSAGASV